MKAMALIAIAALLGSSEAEGDNLPSQSVAAPNNEVPQPLKEASECMFKALKAVPGVSNPKIGTSISNTGQSYPFLECRAAEETQWIQPMRFYYHQEPDGRYDFVAYINGLMLARPENQKFDIHVTDVVIQKWFKQCGVSASIISV